MRGCGFTSRGLGFAVLSSGDQIDVRYVSQLRLHERGLPLSDRGKTGFLIPR